MKTDEITVEVNGRRYGGWLSAQVKTSCTQIASQFACEITQRYPGGSIRINPGDRVEVRIGDDLVMTGFVDAAPVSFDATSVTASISGRSRTADLVDCSIDHEIAAPDVPGLFAGITTRVDKTAVQSAPAGSEWSGVDVKATIARLGRPFGVKLYDTTKKAYKSKKVSVSKGTGVWAAIQKLIAEWSLFATDTETGDLLLAESLRLGTCSTMLVVSRTADETNVLAGSAGRDFSDVYTSYEVFGQQRPADGDDPAAVTNVSGRASSDALARQRTLRIYESGDTSAAACAERAAFESRERLKKARRVTYTVAGWRQPSGDLWKKGFAVQVLDEILSIAGQMLIEGVTYTLDDRGQTCTLELVDL